MTQPRYAHYYLALSVLSTLLFGGSVFNFGPLGMLSPTETTGVVIVSFMALTIFQSVAKR
ncbi:hypothetical protein SAMN05444342_4364 [Haladaptatus paucihalophilus DX253]|uniref:Uncharacterized protein n=1 Tax=Haladaptatus paucihalophilus DX253 TaxID=797209 RepID=A0A1M7CGT7_HALPU|nr:hypothetical protein SAMN05444342_4364 [Haladaptatus paucihalophilus DX253]